MNGFFPKVIDSKEQEALMNDIGAFIGGANDKGKDLYETTEKLATLKEAAMAGVKDDSASAQMNAVYAAALYRDACCAYATRGQILSRGIQSQLTDLHLGAMHGFVYAEEDV